MSLNTCHWCYYLQQLESSLEPSLEHPKTTTLPTSTPGPRTSTDVLALRAQNPSAPVCTVNPTVLSQSQSSQNLLSSTAWMNPPQNESSSFPYASFTPRTFTPHQTLSIHLFLLNWIILYLMLILRMGYVIPYGIRNPFQLIFYFPPFYYIINQLL